jgi:hypothetical protein
LMAGILSFLWMTSCTVTWSKKRGLRKLR